MALSPERQKTLKAGDFVAIHDSHWLSTNLWRVTKVTKTYFWVQYPVGGGYSHHSYKFALNGTCEGFRMSGKHRRWYSPWDSIEAFQADNDRKFEESEKRRERKRLEQYEN